MTIQHTNVCKYTITPSRTQASTLGVFHRFIENADISKPHIGSHKHVFENQIKASSLSSCVQNLLGRGNTCAMKSARDIKRENIARHDLGKLYQNICKSSLVQPADFEFHVSFWQNAPCTVKNQNVADSRYRNMTPPFNSKRNTFIDWDLRNTERA